MAPIRCSYYKCKYSSIQKSMFRFPVRDTRRLPVWLTNCGNMKMAQLSLHELHNRYLCSEHFDKKYINSLNPRRKRLLRLAMPFPCTGEGNSANPPEGFHTQNERLTVSSCPSECTEYRCNNCEEMIQGFRYTCVQCADWDLCAACEARAAHDTHYVLRVPGQRPYKEVQAVLAAIRDEMLRENIFLPQMAASVKEEVKEEITDDAEVPECAEAPEPDPLGAWDFSAHDGGCDAQENYPERKEDDLSPRKRRRTSLDSLANTQNFTPREASSYNNLIVTDDDLRVPALFDSISDDDQTDNYEYIEIIDVDKLTKKSHQTEQDSKQDNNVTIQITKGNCIALPEGRYETLRDDISDKCSIKKPVRTYKNTSRRHRERIGTHGKEMGTDDKGIETNNEGIGTLNKTMIRTDSKEIETDNEGMENRSKITGTYPKSIGAHSEETGRHSKETGKDTKEKGAHSEEAGTDSSEIGTNNVGIGKHSEESETDTKGIGAQSEDTGILTHNEGILRPRKGIEIDAKSIGAHSKEPETHNEGIERHSKGTVTDNKGMT